MRRTARRPRRRRSATRMPRPCASARALTRLSRSSPGSRTPSSTAATSGAASADASSPPSSTTTSPTPGRRHLAQQLVRGSWRATGTARARPRPPGWRAARSPRPLEARPSSTSRTACAASMATRTCASAVDAPRCGVRTSVRGHEQRGVGRRLLLVDVDARRRRVAPRAVRRPGPPRRRPRRARRSAGSRRASSTPAASAPIRPRVERVSGTWRLTTSASASRSARVQQRDAVPSGVFGRQERVRRDDAHRETGRPASRRPGRSCRTRRCRSVRPVQLDAAELASAPTRRAASRHRPRRDVGRRRRAGRSSARPPRSCCRSAR